jgi:hypothetical protein
MTGGAAAIGYVASVGVVGDQGNGNDCNHAQLHQSMLLFECCSMAM